MLPLSFKGKNFGLLCEGAELARHTSLESIGVSHLGSIL